MVFTNIDTNPRDTLQLAETISTLWIDAHTSLTQRVTQTREVESETLHHIPGPWFLQMSRGMIRTITREKVGIVHRKAFIG